MKILIEIPNDKVPQRQDIIDIPLHFVDGQICDAGGYGFKIMELKEDMDFDKLKKIFSTTLDNADTLNEWLLRIIQGAYIQGQKELLN